MARYSGYGVIGLAMVLLGVLILIPFLKQIFPQIENFNNPLYKDTRLYNALVNRNPGAPKCNIVRRCPQGTFCVSYNDVLDSTLGITFGDPQKNGVCLNNSARSSPFYRKLSEEVLSIFKDFERMRDRKKEIQQQQEVLNKKGRQPWYNNLQMT